MATYAYLIIFCVFAMSHAVSGVGLNESCSTADCDVPLICDNSICMTKIGGDCVNNTECVDASQCLSGTCQCPTGFYGLNDSACVAQKTAGVTCNDSRECVSDFFCNISTETLGTCECNAGTYQLNDTICDQMTKIGGDCVNNTECVDASQCLSGTCQCPTGFYGLNDSACVAQKTAGVTCNDSRECVSDFFCNISTETLGTCECNAGTYQLNDTICDQMTKIGGDCVNNTECVDASQCLSGTCQCPTGFYGLNDSACVAQKTAGVTCNDSRECVSDFFCNISTETLGTCECNAGTYQLNDTICDQKKIIGESCKKNIECVSGSFCNISSSTCECPAGTYQLNSTICDQKKIIGESCNNNTECVSGSFCNISSNTCECPSGTYQLNDTICDQKKGHGSVCAINDECSSKFSCLNEKCVCSNDGRFSEDVCYTLDQFQVNVTASTVKTTSASLTWTSNKYGYIVTYKISVNQASSSVKTSNNDLGGSVTDLSPGTQYTLSITSTIAADNIYGPSTTSTTQTVTTKQEHGGSCNATVQCSSQLSECQNSICRCPSGQRFSSGSCFSLDQFQVNVTASTVETTSASLTWTSNKYGYTVTYKISVNQASSSVKTSQDDLGGSVTDLSPGTQYTLSITSTIAADNIYGSSTTSTTQTVTTKQIHGGACNVTVKCSSQWQCQNDICRCPNGERFSNDACYSFDKFKVNVTSTKVTTTSVTLKWDANKYGLDVTYSISVAPQETSATQSATVQGGDVQDLTPGRLYNLTITSTIPADTLYLQEAVTETLTVWMIPSKPSGDVKAERENGSTYTFSFDGSNGQVAYYSVDIVGLPEFPRDTIATEISNLILIPSKTYSYTIIAVNGNGNQSEPSQGIFTVGAERPGKVSGLAKRNSTDTSLGVEWMKPANPNGDLIGYLVTYSILEPEGTCMEINITCSDCMDPWPSSETSSCTKFPALVEKLEGLLNDSRVKLYQDISGLKADRSYTIQVQAVNKAGYGRPDSITAKTKVGAAKAPVSLEASKTGSNTTAGLTIIWTPGEKTGPTDYKVKIEEEKSINSISYYDNITQTLSGYENSTLDVNGLLAFWNYKVSVTASTSVGGESQPIMKTFKTKPNIPGYVTGFGVTLSSTDAQKFTLSFACPSEKDRNGELSKYTVRVRKSNEGTGEEKDIAHDGTCSFQTENFVSQPLTVGEEYTFEVKVINRMYSGTFNQGETYRIVPKVPMLKPVGPSLIVGPTDSALTDNSVMVTVCSDCLLDNRQGEITSVDLLVCISIDNKPCGAQPVSPTDAKTYSQAKSNNFLDPYITTPPQWRQTLSNDKNNRRNTTFIVGNTKNCQPDASTFCNGPLPDGAQVKIIVISCTSAGCATFEYATSYQTQAASSDDVPVGAIIGGIVGVILIVVIILGALFWWRRRRIPKATQSDARMSIPEPLIRRERPVSVRHFESEVARYHKDANLLFQDDFEDIKKLSDLKHSTECAQLEENRVKNRYVNILPYDHSRVKLSTPPDGHESMDFINGNYIPGFNSVREYIATQGPMYSTIPDFWRMMWEQNSRIIVMLSDLQEAGKRKVDLYWPENLNEPINYGNIVVEMTHFSQLNKYTIRNLNMSWGENETRRVTHFFLAGWLDFSANLKFSDVIEFAKLVRQESRPVSDGPITVHCSAGVGRTGTFIALDYFLQHLDKYGLDGQIDIFSYVMRMRYNRPSMVQAETQYIFIYDALNEYIKKKLEDENSNEYVNYSKNEEKPKESEESVYMNTNGQSELINMQGYDNKGYEDTENSKPPTPTTNL